MLSYKTELSEFWKIEIVYSMFCDHRRIKLEIKQVNLGYY